MRVLVTGPESSGTRMLTALLRGSGLDASHSSPRYRHGDSGGFKYSHRAFDAVVLIVRNGAWNQDSMVSRGHALDAEDARAWIATDLLDVLSCFVPFGVPVHLVTYESLVYEQDASFQALLDELGAGPGGLTEPVRNGNTKWVRARAGLQGGWPGDDRRLEERLP